MKKSVALILTAILAVATVRAADSSSEFLVNNWRNEEGLPHSIINAMVQTRDGYLWIATYVGLVRFDGARFVHYNSSNVPELQDGRISALLEDRDGTLWIALETGRLLAWKEGSVRVHLPGGPGQNQAIVTLAQDRKGTIWLQTADCQLGRLTTNGIELLARTAPGLGRPSLALAVDPHDQLWVGTRDGLQIWQNGALTIPPGLESLMGTNCHAAAPARDGSMWMCREGKLWKLRSGGIVAHFQIPLSAGDFIVSLLESVDGRVWLATNDGSLLCLEASGQWKTIPGTGLRGSSRVLYEDREGNLWRGSFGGGLTRIRPRLFTLHELPESVLDRYAFTVCAEPSGGVWGLLNSHTLARVSARAPVPEIWNNPSMPRNIRSLCYNSRGVLWAGGDGAELLRMRDGQFVPELKVGEQIEFISALFEDAQSNLWVGFTGGAGVGVLPNGESAKWNAIRGMPFPVVRCIAQTADGAMWFGTHYGGVCRWKNGQWTQYRMQEGLPSDYVRSLFADADGTLWLGTLRGICRWRNGKFVSIKKEDGLWNDSISHIAEDEQGNFWVSSFGGIFRVKRQDLNDFADGKKQGVSCIGYNRNDGLISLECPGGFQPAGAKTLDGRLWFPTVSGLVSISPSQIKENTLEPPVWIEEVTVDNAPIIVRHETRTLKIPPGKRRFDFRFAALSLTAPEKVRFRHKLEGLDTDWSLPSDQRTVSYSYIPPGPYTLKVVACNNDGVWNNVGSSLELKIQPFVWQTWWFKGGMAALLAVLVAFIVWQAERWNSRLRLERLEQQHAVERERSRIAKDIHDDLGANLTQIVFLSQRAEDTSHDAKEVERWIRRIPATARRTIQSLDEIVWAINPRHDSLESLANYLSQFVSDHLNLAGLRAVLDVPTVLPAVQLSAELRHNLVLAAREAVQNVVTHAAATEVRLSLNLEDSGLTITISDNGRGFDLNQPSRDGNGLHNMRRRLEDIGGQAEITSRPGDGTTVRLFVPQTRLHARVIGEHNGNTRIS